MNRERLVIAKQIEDVEKELECAVDDSASFEARNCERIADLNEQLNDLENEVCFEDTLSGQILKLHKEALEEIKVIISDFEQKTGINLAFTLKIVG